MALQNTDFGVPQKSSKAFPDFNFLSRWGGGGHPPPQP